MKCKYCNRIIEVDEDDLYSTESYRRLVLHVWQFHDETNQGISLKETLANGPSGEEE